MPTVSPTPNVASFRTVLYLMGQKAGQVLRDGRIGGIWQAQFLKSYPALPGRHVITFYLREESFDDDAVQIFAQQLRLDSPPTNLRPLPNKVTSCFWFLGCSNNCSFAERH
jgi:hypothetical protein